MRQIEVANLVAAADVVNLAVGGVVDQMIDGATMIQHVQPIPHVAAVAVERHGNIVDEIGHKQRQHFSGN